MAYCPRCGTENDPSVRRCPLCATEIPRLDDEPGHPAWPEADGDSHSRVFATPGQRRLRVFVGLSVLLLFPAVIVTGVDALVTGHLSWSWIPDLALGGTFALVTAGFVWYRRPVGLLTAWAGITATILLAADGLDGEAFGWSLTLGLPATAGAALLIGALVVWLRRHRSPGWNVFGHVLLGTAAYCVALEALIRATVTAATPLWWSGIVALVLVPLGLLFHALHRFSSRPLNLRQTFHL